MGAVLTEVSLSVCRAYQGSPCLSEGEYGREVTFQEPVQKQVRVQLRQQGLQAMNLWMEAAMHLRAFEKARIMKRFAAGSGGKSPRNAVLEPVSVPAEEKRTS